MNHENAVHRQADGDLAVTYLIACHNLARYVGDCLTSLLRQSDSRWRAIVVDDASTDDSRAVITRMLDPRMRFVCHERNLGYIATLRRMIAEADTDIVAILDADDALSADATSRLLDAYAANGSTAFAYSRFALYDEQLEQVLAVHGSAVPPGGTALWHATVGHIVSFRRSTYCLTGGLDDSMLYAEDRDLVFKLEEVAAPVFIDAVLYHYRQVPGSQSRDPVKREIGARNSRRARSAALRRRGVRGVARLAWEIFFGANYLVYSWRTPGFIRALAGGAARFLNPYVQPGRLGAVPPSIATERSPTDRSA